MGGVTFQICAASDAKGKWKIVPCQDEKPASSGPVQASVPADTTAPAADASTLKAPELNYAEYTKTQSAYQLGAGVEPFHFDVAPVATAGVASESVEPTTDEILMAGIASGYQGYNTGLSAGQLLPPHPVLVRSIDGRWAADAGEAMRRGMVVGRAFENPGVPQNSDQRVLRDVLYSSMGLVSGLVAAGWANTQEEQQNDFIFHLYSPYQAPNPEFTTETPKE